MIYYGQDAWIPDVLERIERRVSDRTGLARDKVFTYWGEASDLLQFPLGDKFASVGFEQLAGDYGMVTGGGAALSGFDQIVRVDLFLRLGIDREGFDVRLLRDKQNGFGTILKNACAGLQTWTMAEDDGTGNFTSLLRQPMRILSVQGNPRKPTTGWAWVRIRAEAKFVANLKLSDGSNL